MFGRLEASRRMGYTKLNYESSAGAPRKFGVAMPPMQDRLAAVSKVERIAHGSGGQRKFHEKRGLLLGGRDKAGPSMEEAFREKLYAVGAEPVPKALRAERAVENLELGVLRDHAFVPNEEPHFLAGRPAASDRDLSAGRTRFQRVF